MDRTGCPDHRHATLDHDFAASMRSLRIISDTAVLAAGWAFLALATAVSCETLLRRFAGVSIQGLDEYGGYVLAVGSAFGLSYALFERAHIRVDVLIRFLPPALRAGADLLAAVALLAVSLLLVRAATSVVRSSWELQARAVSPLQTPLIVPQGLWAAALILFAISCIVVTSCIVLRLVRRDWRGVARIGGVPSPDEEIAAELSDVKRRGAGGRR